MEIGDFVMCSDLTNAPNEIGLTHGVSYEVIGVSELNGTINIVNDNGYAGRYPFYLFYKVDVKNKPTTKHYNESVQPIDLIEAFNLGFNRGNVIKYVSRAGRKDNELEDLEKALWYLEREIDNLKNK